MTPRFERSHAATRDPRPWLVIAVEGHTEERYFNELRVRHRLPEGRVRIFCEGSAPLTVVRCAVREAERARADKADSRGEAWAVVDGEEHQGTVGQRHGWNDAGQTAPSRNVNLAVSNPSFELWLLLHFREHTGSLDRAEAARLLAGGMGAGYAKGQPILARLSPHGDEREAVQRAQVLLRREEEHGTGPHANPSTRVHQVLEALMRIQSYAPRTGRRSTTPA